MQVLSAAFLSPDHNTDRAFVHQKEREQIVLRVYSQIAKSAGMWGLLVWLGLDVIIAEVMQILCHPVSSDSLQQGIVRTGWSVTTGTQQSRMTSACGFHSDVVVTTTMPAYSSSGRRLGCQLWRHRQSVVWLSQLLHSSLFSLFCFLYSFYTSNFFSLALLLSFDLVVTLCPSSVSFFFFFF